MMILWTSAQRQNPILRVAKSLDRRDFDSADMMFDAANGEAWEKAGRPADEPGTPWWDWETEAQRKIERTFR